jgi:sugar lactone lactonase YvrE
MSIATTFYRKILLLFAASVLLFTSNTFCQNLEIYVSDAGNYSNPPWKILKFDENGENPEIFINTNLAWPQDIVFMEEQQVVLISNLNTGRITKYNSTTGQYVEDFATGIGGPTRMKIGEDSLLYVLQWSGNGKVRRYQLDGTFVDEFTTVGVAQSIGIDWDSSGNLYVSSYSGKNVRKFDENGNDMGLFVTTNLLGPTNIWFDDNGDLLVIDYNGTSVKRFDPNGNYLNDFITGLSNSEGVDFFPNGDILIGNGATSSVKLFDSAGTYIEDLIPSGAGNLKTPNAVVIRDITAVSVPDESSINIFEFILKQNYPNPFNSTTKIRFTIPSIIASGTKQSQLITLKVYNVLGKEIATLVNENLPGGEHEVNFNATSLTSGVYFYQLKIGSFIQTNKMVYMQ